MKKIGVIISFSLLAFSTFGILLLLLTACQNDTTTKLLYQGHASVRLSSKNGTVINIDPFVLAFQEPK